MRLSYCLFIFCYSNLSIRYRFNNDHKLVVIFGQIHQPFLQCKLEAGRVSRFEKSLSRLSRSLSTSVVGFSRLKRFQSRFWWANELWADILVWISQTSGSFWWFLHLVVFLEIYVAELLLSRLHHREPEEDCYLFEKIYKFFHSEHLFYFFHGFKKL